MQREAKSNREEERVKKKKRLNKVEKPTKRLCIFITSNSFSMHVDSKDFENMVYKGEQDDF